MKTILSILICIFFLISIKNIFAQKEVDINLNSKVPKQILGGVPHEGNLEILIYDNANMQVNRFISGKWWNQWFGTCSKSILLFVGNDVYSGIGCYYSSATALLETVSNININANTNELILEKPGVIKIKQVTFYPPGTAEIYYTWEISNLSDSIVYDLRFFVGGDTYLQFDDYGVGYWSPSNNTIGVEKKAGSNMLKLSLQGITPPYAYESQYYLDVFQHVTSHSLTNEINQDESTDNGLALEYRKSSLLPDSTWEIKTIEKFDAVFIPNVEVKAPLSGYIEAGDSIEIEFELRNLINCVFSVTLQPEIDINDWKVELISPSSPLWLGPFESLDVVLKIVCPNETLVGTKASIKLNVREMGGTVSDSCLFTVIIKPEIIEQPHNQEVCSGDSVIFKVDAINALSYQWQEFDTIWRDISDTGIYGGSGTSALTISDVPSYMNNNKYRCIVSNSYGSVSSNNAILTVYEPAVIVNQPVSATICEGNNTSYHIAATGEGLTYQWQVNAKAGYYNVLNGGVYNGATTNSLVISGAPYTMNEYIYRCVIGNSCSPDTISNEARLTVERAPYISDQPISSAICEGENTSFSITALGYGLSYQWQANEGSGFINIVNGNVYSGVNTNILSVTNAGTAMNGYEYRCAVNGSCLPPAISNEAVLIVNERPVVNLGNDTLLCENQTITLDAGPGISYIWSYPELNGQIVTINYALLGLGTHPVSVIVTNAGNCEGSDTIEITYTICTGQNSYNQDSEIELIPNPTSGLFCINLPASIEKAGIEIYNMTGTRVMKEKIYRTFQISVDMSKLAKGTYTIKIITENQIIFKKMIVY
jgi:hypothetical protein